MRITVESRIEQTPPALQTASLADLEIGGFFKVSWAVELPLKERDWKISLITGPMGISTKIAFSRPRILR